MTDCAARSCRNESSSHMIIPLSGHRNVVTSNLCGLDNFGVQAMEFWREATGVAVAAGLGSFNTVGTTRGSLVSSDSSKEMTEHMRRRQHLPMTVNASWIIAETSGVAKCLSCHVSDAIKFTLIWLVGVIMGTLVTFETLVAKEVDVTHVDLLDALEF